MPNYLYIILNDYIFNHRLNFKYKNNTSGDAQVWNISKELSYLSLLTPPHTSLHPTLLKTGTFAYPGKKLKEYFSGREGDNFCWLFLHI